MVSYFITIYIIYTHHDIWFLIFGMWYMIVYDILICRIHTSNIYICDTIHLYVCIYIHNRYAHLAYIYRHMIYIYIYMYVCV